MEYFGWRRAELAHWLKWVPDLEQTELFPMGGLTRVPSHAILDKVGSVSAPEDGGQSGDPYQS